MVPNRAKLHTFICKSQSKSNQANANAFYNKPRQKTNSSKKNSLKNCQVLQREQVFQRVLQKQRCFVKKVFLKISQNSPENACVRVYFLNKVAGCKKETLAQVLCLEFCRIFRDTFFIEHLQWLLLALVVTKCDKNILQSMTGVGPYVLYKLCFQHFVKQHFIDSNLLPIAILNSTL